MAAVTSLCSKAMYLRAGVLNLAGKTSEVIQTYLRDISTGVDLRLLERQDRQGSGIARFSSVQLLDPAGLPTELVMSGDRTRIIVNLSPQREGLVLETQHLSGSTIPWGSGSCI